jgi:YVTN family beta-propeller protein
MQNDGEVQRRLIFLIILNIIVVVSVVVLSDVTYAREILELHKKTLYEITKHTSSKENPHITVGKVPSAISVNDITNTIYVANQEDNTVSVIDGKNNTKIGDDIKVGEGPLLDISVNPITNTIYVANYLYNTISVIDGKNNTKIGDDIKVGRAPSAIDVDFGTYTIYVANHDNTLSVIDGQTNKLVAKVTFNNEPFNAGHIECDKDKLIAPVAQQFYVWSGSECKAKPNQGFEFVSWQENLDGNSTQLIKFSSPSSISDSIIEALDFLHPKPDKQEATLNITKFGSFTANFKALPPPIPAEYVATLFTVVATAFIGSWLTPTVIGWRKTKKQGSKLDHYHDEVKNLYNDGRLDRNDIGTLNILRDKITDEYTRGKINKEQYDKLGDEISINYREIFIKEIDSLNNFSENDKVERLSEIRSNIEDTHAKGKIKDEYYTNLKKEISILYEEVFKKRIDSLNNLPENDKVKLLDKIKDDISDAYSKEKVNELHYTLLKEKLSKYEKSKI